MSSFWFRRAALLLASLAAAASVSARGTCDVDDNSVIDLADINLIVSARNTAASGADDPRDADGNGVINAVDARTCQARCTRPRCSTINVPPLANADRYAANAGETLMVPAGRGVLANDRDTEGSPLSAVLVTPASVGALSLAADGGFSYSAPTHFVGVASFQYKASDGTTDSAAATVSIGVLPATAATTIGVAGGILDGPDGVRVEVPPGALATDTLIRITRSGAGAPPLPAELPAGAPVYELTPHGLAFGAPVTISLPAPAGIDPPAWMASPGEAWQPVFTALAAGRLAWQVRHFSWFTVPVDCLIPAGSTDPYPCSRARSLPWLSSAPAGAITDVDGWHMNYRLTEEATVSIDYRYRAAKDCISGRVQMWYQPYDVLPYVAPVRFYDAAATLSVGPTEATGATIVPYSFTLADRGVHLVLLSFSCDRLYDGRRLTTGGGLYIDARGLVAVPPVITLHPADQVVTEPASATFTAAAANPSAGVQWQRSNDGGVTWLDLAGATATSYTTPPTALADDASLYRAVFANSVGQHTPSDPARLRVQPMAATPTFVTQPAGQTVTAGATATFTVAVTGIPMPSLQWEISRDGGVTWTPIPGATGSSYTTPATVAGDNGALYRAVASNGTAVASDSAMLTIAGSSLATSPDGKISSFAFHTCAVRQNGSLACWGQGLDGQLGIGRQDTTSMPLTVTGLSQVLFVAAGWQDTCAIHHGGELACWGFLNDSLSPNPISGVTDAIWVAVGAEHACYVDSPGHVWCWGSNQFGELGDGGSGYTRSSPVAVKWADGSPMTGAVSVAAGRSFTCAQLVGGEVYCWGADVGAGIRSSPQRIRQRLPGGSMMDFTAYGRLAAGLDHACAPDAASSQALCWGGNGDGQLGDNSTTGRDDAMTTSGLSGVERVLGGQTHSCGIRASDMVCWGSTYMGNGAAVQTLLYPQVAGRVGSLAGVADPVINAAAGARHTCVLRSNGDVQCWGANASGALGVGDFSERTLPVSTTDGAVFWHP